MNNVLIGVVIIGGFAALIFFVLRARKKEKIRDAWKLGPESQAWQIMRSGVQPVVQNGRRLFYEAGLTHRPELGEAFNRGILKCDEKGRCAGYAVERNDRPTTAVILKSQLSPESRVPSFRVHIGVTDPYFNSEFDIERGNPDNDAHYVLAAGQTISSGDPNGFICILPYCDAQFDDYFATGTEYEREHDLLCWFDGDKYEATKYHLAQGHPLILDCPGAESLSATRVHYSSHAGSRNAICTLLVK